jgi:hypothetical protein
MPRHGCNVAFNAPAAGAPIATIHTGATGQARIIQLAVYITAATATSPALYRASNTPVATTSSLGQPLDPNDIASLVNMDTAWSTAPLIGSNVAIKGATIAATAGAGMVWQWNREIYIPRSSWLVIWHFGAATGSAGRIEAEWDE